MTVMYKMFAHETNYKIFEKNNIAVSFYKM
jgi:hypothetical protein